MENGGRYSRRRTHEAGAYIRVIFGKRANLENSG